jgi:hypothetical protein
MPVLASQTVRNGLDGDYYVKVGSGGSSTIPGNLTVNGTLFVDNIEPISTSEPVYINAPNEIGGTQLNNNALIVKGGENRIADGSGAQVGFATYKPFTRGTVNHTVGEDVGSFASWGKDTSDNDVRYGSIFINTTDPTPTNKQGRMNFSIQKNNVFSAMLQIDGSQNRVSVFDGASLTVDGRISTLADISCNGDVYVGDDLFVADNVNCQDVLATASVQANRFVSLGTTDPSALAGIDFRVDGASAGRTNHDAVNMNITGLTGTASAVQQICGTRIASRAIKDASNNITMTFGASGVSATADVSNVILRVQDSNGTFFVPCSYSVEIITGGGTALPLDATTSTFTPKYSGSYHFEMTYLFDTSGNGGQVNDDNVFGFRVSGAGNDYGACIAGKAITLPASGNALPYTISSIHQLIAGTTYTITYIYLGTAGSMGGTAGGYLLEANLV